MKQKLKCIKCGKVFRALRSDAKTCSNACRQAMWRVRKAAR